MPESETSRKQAAAGKRDWLAHWIGNAAWEQAIEVGRDGVTALPVFAVDFSLDRPVRSAALRVTALGVYEATANGWPVSTAVLEPPHTDSRTRLVYATYDITGLLTPGPNLLSVEVGPGLAHVPPTPGRYQKLTRSDGPPRLLAQLDIVHEDGTVLTVASGASWRTALGCTTFSGWYGGEDHDARRIPLGWTPALDLGPVGIGPRLTPRYSPAIEPVETLSVQAITEPRPGVYVFDFGVNFAGWQQLSVSGPRDTVVTMRPGELLAADGTVVQDLDGTGVPIWDTYTLAGGGAEVWHPRFRYHGMRYLQVEGLPGEPDQDTFIGIVLRAANEKVGTFSSSNDLLTNLHTIIDRAIQSNMYSVLTDCPHREKLGWLEQVHLVFGPVAFGYDVADYFQDLVRVIAEAQTEEGLVPSLAPEYVVFEDGFRDDPNWGSSIVLAPWALYREYGDIETAREHYPAMVRYLGYLGYLADGNLLHHGLGDWAAIDERTPVGVTASFGYHQAASTMARIAALIGRYDDAAHWAELTDKIGAAFNAAYFRPMDGTYGTGSQACDALALDLGVVPQADRRRVLDHLVADIRAHGNHLTVGEIPLPSVLRVLAAAGRHDVIWDIVTETSYPGYGYLVGSGATALPEYWDGPGGHGSQNHFMLGAIDSWLTGCLAGLGQGAESVAYRDLVIRPVVVGDLTEVTAQTRTIRGVVRSHWHRTNDTFHLDVTVPPGPTATVCVPLRTLNTHVTAPKAAQPVGTFDSYAYYRVGPGDWSFRSTG
ncbi:family 78 glycoside hydrolase catalytic domain [Streptomyces sp. NPDC088196]|uniref:family 78 glycoside hydrolase catalytic domain n=1 Tax=Streptomyces sp. NPDC088196 TaxID=3154868 RepID=UPI00344EF107